MTREDTIKILSVLRGAYPAFYRDITKQEAESTIALWGSMFEEEPYELVGAAVKAFISADAKGFPPAIGQIKERIRQITQPEEMTEQEAWALVSKAVQRSTYGSVEVSLSNQPFSHLFYRLSLLSSPPCTVGYLFRA